MSADRTAVLAHMRWLRSRMPDEHGEVRCTALVAVTSQKFGHEEWLQDDTHFVWELALRVHDEHNAIRRA